MVDGGWPTRELALGADRFAKTDFFTFVYYEKRSIFHSCRK